MLQANVDLVAEKDIDLGYNDVVKMTIDTGDARPFKTRTYRVSSSCRMYGMSFYCE